jgi:hypothetical protein
MRSRVARPLLTSLGTVTLLAASSFVVLAVSSTGSMRPTDWTHTDLSAATSRYQLCAKQGLGAIGCMLGSGFRPAAAADSGARQSSKPLVSVATVQDEGPGTSGPAWTPGRHWTSGGRPGSQHLVKLPPNASTAEVLAACQAAMKTAMAQGSAAMTEVEDECEADLESHCPAATRTTATTGPAAMKEFEDECGFPTPNPSPGRDS